MLEFYFLLHFPAYFNRLRSNISCHYFILILLLHEITLITNKLLLVFLESVIIRRFLWNKDFIDIIDGNSVLCFADYCAIPGSIIPEIWLSPSNNFYFYLWFYFFLIRLFLPVYYCLWDYYSGTRFASLRVTFPKME
jgi:hypothetical protein